MKQHNFFVVGYENPETWYEEWNNLLDTVLADMEVGGGASEEARSGIMVLDFGLVCTDDEAAHVASALKGRFSHCLGYYQEHAVGEVEYG